MEKYKLLIQLIKYIPVIGALCMLIHVISLLFGYTPLFSHVMFGFSILGTLLLILASYTLKFCTLHRMFIVYDFIVENCINYQTYIGFDELLNPMRWVVLIVGIILFIWFSLCRLQCN